MNNVLHYKGNNNKAMPFNMLNHQSFYKGCAQH